MRRDADVVQALEDVLGDTVVQNAFAFNHFVLLGVERGRVVLEVLDQGPRLRSLVEDFGLAFINSSAAVHAMQPWLEKIHRVGLFWCCLA